MELGPEDVSLLERCPHFRGWYVQASMQLGPEDVFLLEKCPHFRGWYVLVRQTYQAHRDDSGPFKAAAKGSSLSTAQPLVARAIYQGINIYKPIQGVQVWK